MSSPDSFERLAYISQEIVSYVQFPNSLAFQLPEYLEATRVTKYHYFMRDGMENARNDIRMLAEMINPYQRQKYEAIPEQERGGWVNRFLAWDPKLDEDGISLLEEESKQLATTPITYSHLNESQRLGAVILRAAGYQSILKHYKDLLAKYPQI